MRRLRRLLAGARALMRGRIREQELDDELRTYLDMAIADKIRAGMSREQATRAARLETGLVAMDGVKAQVREIGWEVWIETLWQDTLRAGRLLARDRVFTAAAVVALGLAIGLNTSVFAIINAAFLRDVPLDEPHRLLTIQLRDRRSAPPDRAPGQGVALVAASYADLLDWREQATVFEGLTASIPGAMTLSGDGVPAERLRGSYLTGNTFAVLRVAPVLGRDFTDADDAAGAPSVVMLGYEVWQSRYGGDANAIGHTVRVNDVPAVIIGVMPPGFNYPTVDQVWQSIASAPGFAAAKGGGRNLAVVGRLRPDTDLPRARAELDAVVARRAPGSPDPYGHLVSVVRPLRERYPTPPLPMIAAFMGAVSLVLLIAYANLANLLLARSIRRAREIAIRMALGSSRRRIVRQFLLECLLIAFAGGILGFGLSLYGVREIAIAFEPIEPGIALGSVPSNRPFWVDVNPDATLYAFVGLVSIVSALGFGMLPAWQMSKTRINDTLKAESRSPGGSPARRWTSVLLVAELALALTLLSGAGLLWRGFIDQYRQDTVIDTSGLVTMRLALPAQKYATPAERKRFVEQLRQRLGELTALPAVTMASHPPLEPRVAAREVWLEEVHYAPDEQPPNVGVILTGSRYFETLALPIVRGRAIHDSDAKPGQEGAVVDERFVSRFLPDQEPIGRRIRIGRDGLWHTIVGVARALPESGPASDRLPLVYAPLEAEAAPDGAATIIVKGPLVSATALLREEVRALDPALPLFGIETLDEALARTRLPARMFGTWFGAIALVALVLAAVGVGAITAHSVIQRTEEIGVRMALGADGRNVVAMFLRRSLTLLAIAVSLGLVGSVALGHVLGLLNGGGRGDVVTLAIVTVVLGATTLLATLLPTRRAARIDPLVALRGE